MSRNVAGGELQVDAAQQRPKANRLRLVPVALGLGVALALAGCSSGQITQTDTQVAAVNGAGGQQGAIAVRGAQLAYPAGRGVYPEGSDAPLIVQITNTGDNPDKLVSVTSPDAAGGRVEGTADLPGHFALVTELRDGHEATESSPKATTGAPTTSAPSGPTGTGQPTTGTPTGTPTGAATGTPTGGTTGAPTGTGAAAPTGKSEPGKVKITLTGLKREVAPGQTIKVTFLFQNAGELTLELPIGAPSAPRTGDVDHSGQPAPGHGSGHGGGH
ncbi:hypothetical protein LX15_006215 [Streptoalloteichus tenebrarius]|uniref:Copper chaperone PCu(A)C n=1 Tax=Streptoalloteichus tenebrarius (strain ATCC 17920 / DSM 40477 / JCM 4838 / CBS 697.72 / NBRC 16177 / NCIMB 11028 / NRRL B-12390 / A12253. 1 / ISP 5477) TaxID=1933 RepID=A0ABT1I3V9_STRSD|nr:copper chaperone PCu(A)C [Streptoalloteichus tenebrarius]MCP2262476.1 hypothetical protein [Streptoalloteichus tenebrarius]BFF01555.1 hypothetical protein GCM10020241_32300 [Streptoalloteichus tenebrarius]